MSNLEKKIESIMDYVTQLVSDLDDDQLWETYKMLAYRCQSKVDDLEDAQDEKAAEDISE
ncbi:hypothetical protein [Pedobacter sp. NJ-S-72]